MTGRPMPIPQSAAGITVATAPAVLYLLFEGGAPLHAAPALEEHLAEGRLVPGHRGVPLAVGEMQSGLDVVTLPGMTGAFVACWAAEPVTGTPERDHHAWEHARVAAAGQAEGLVAVAQRTLLEGGARGLMNGPAARGRTRLPAAGTYSWVEIRWIFVAQVPTP